jgi:hypothetical protein
MTLKHMFIQIEPFRSAVLSLLLPFDVSRLLKAMQCELSEWEKSVYLNVLDDIFEDTTAITKMAEAGMTVRIFGSDLTRLEERLRSPSAHCVSSIQEYRLFVLVSYRSDEPNGNATLVRDYRQASEQGFVPDDFNIAELHSHFSASVATQIATFSRWILCAPYLSGTMPNTVPGWIPVLSTRPHIDVRTYISTYNDCNGKFLYMDRKLTRKLFGFETEDDLLRNLSNLSTACLKLDRGSKVRHTLKGTLTIDFLHNLLARSQRRQDDGFVIVHALHSSKCSVILEIV